MSKEITTIYLNTWGAYNNGCIGYGWMTPEDARDFIEANPERDGGEWFIADIDNYCRVDFGNLDYADFFEVIDTLEALNDMDKEEQCETVAVMEYLNTKDAQEAIDKIDSLTIFSDIDAYFESCDELIDEYAHGVPEMLTRYFDYDAYHCDCAFDVYEASNGVCIME